MEHAVIIGNGAAGITAARHLRSIEPQWRITVISGESKYHFSRPAMMYIFMGHMRYVDTKPLEDHIWEQERIELVRDWVTEIDADASTLKLHKGVTLAYDKLLLATGSKSNKFGWPGQDLKRVQGLYDLMDLHQLYENVKGTRHAVIVGGGLIGIEFGEMLHSCHIPVTFVVREKSYWDNVLPAEESAMVTRIIQEAGFKLHLETELKEIVDDGSGAACAVITGHGERIDAQLVGLTAGVSPNLDLVRESKIDTNRGILVDWGLRTNVPNIFAAGDCAEIVNEGETRNLMQQVWYTGKMQGKTAAEAMAGREVRYDPGIWYNSAKFLDLEYQTYGFVPNTPNPRHTNLWWEHQSGRKGLRLIYGETGEFVAMNIMGMRARHKECESWIREKRPIDYVLDHLEDVRFETEFSDRHEEEIVKSLRSQMP